MQNKVNKQNELKAQNKATTREIPSPSFAKLVKDEPTKDTSTFKEIKRLRTENLRLTNELSKALEELSRKDEFSMVLNTFGEEKYDLRRMFMYKAKVAKQERLVK